MRPRRYRWGAALIAGTLAAGLVACGEEPEGDLVLSSLQIRYRLRNHAIEATTADGQHYYIYFSPSNTTRVVTDASSEFGHWHADDQNQLCISGYDTPELCAPLIQETVAHYRWGTTGFNMLDVR